MQFDDTIPFTKFLLPNGKREKISFKCALETTSKAKELIEAGFLFEYEELRNGAIHIDCCTSELQLASELVFSTQESKLLKAIDKLVEKAYLRWRQTDKN